MGSVSSTYSNTFAPLFNKVEKKRITIVGVDSAGKSTMLQQMNLGDIVLTIPTIGFNVEAVDFKNIQFINFDLGGGDKIRPLWKHYYQGSVGLVFVIDSVDRERIYENVDWIEWVLGQNELRDCPVLFLANKQDDPKAMPLAEIPVKFELNRIRSHKWHLQGTCGLSGTGVKEGFEWLVTTICEDF